MKLFIFSFSIILFFSCNNNPRPVVQIEPENVTQELIDSVLTEFTFNYKNPQIIDSTDYVLIPISTEDNRRAKSRKFSSYGSEWRYEDCWNIVFFNTRTGTTSLLTDSKMKISSFSPNLRDKGEVLKNSILYKIKHNDYNLDKKINNLDPEHLFISNINGTGLKRLTPENEDLLSYTILSQSNQLLFQTKRDINKDKKFTSEDELIWYSLNLVDHSKPKEIIDTLLRNKIKTQFFNQWIMKKN